MANWPRPVSFPTRRNSSGDSEMKRAQVNGGGLRLEIKRGHPGDTESAKGEKNHITSNPGCLTWSPKIGNGFKSSEKVGGRGREERERRGRGVRSESEKLGDGVAGERRGGKARRCVCVCVGACVCMEWGADRMVSKPKQWYVWWTGRGRASGRGPGEEERSVLTDTNNQPCTPKHWQGHRRRNNQAVYTSMCRSVQNKV